MNKNFSVKHAFCVLGLSLLLILVFTGFSRPVSAKADETARLNVTEASIAKDSVFRLRVYNAPKNAKIVLQDSTAVVVVQPMHLISQVAYWVTIMWAANFKRNV